MMRKDRNFPFYVQGYAHKAPAAHPPNRNQQQDKDLCFQSRVTSGGKNAVLVVGFRFVLRNSKHSKLLLLQNQLTAWHNSSANPGPSTANRKRKREGLSCRISVLRERVRGA
jgi:hypothetical protein